MAAASLGTRSRYRPDRWLTLKWLVVSTGLVAVAGVVAAGANDPGSLAEPLYPLGLPAVPLAVLGCVLVAALPSALAPTPVGACARVQEALA